MPLLFGLTCGVSALAELDSARSVGVEFVLRTEGSLVCDESSVDDGSLAAAYAAENDEMPGSTVATVAVRSSDENNRLNIAADPCSQANIARFSQPSSATLARPGLTRFGWPRNRTRFNEISQISGMSRDTQGLKKVFSPLNRIHRSIRPSFEAVIRRYRPDRFV
jgi:hypothetical protein